MRSPPTPISSYICFDMSYKTAHGGLIAGKGEMEAGEQRKTRRESQDLSAFQGVENTSARWVELSPW
jgi:hypothetical protein